jgi:hypothetical protein
MFYSTEFENLVIENTNLQKQITYAGKVAEESQEKSSALVFFHLFDSK